MKRPISVAILVLALTGCTAVPAPAPSPDLAVCTELAENSREGRFWDVVGYVGSYASDRDSVDRDDVLAAIDALDSLSDGTTDEVAAAFRGMREVLEDIDERYTGDDPLAAVDYQAFQDEGDKLFDACHAVVDEELGDE